MTEIQPIFMIFEFLNRQICFEILLKGSEVICQPHMAVQIDALLNLGLSDIAVARKVLKITKMSRSGA